MNTCKDKTNEGRYTISLYVSHL